MNYTRDTGRPNPGAGKTAKTGKTRTAGNGAVFIVLAGLAAAALSGCGILGPGTEPSAAPSTTSASGTPSPTASEGSTPGTPSPTASESPGGVTEAEKTRIVFPDPGGAEQFDEPLEAARSFAADFVGFTDPLIGDFLQGDNRSGEVEVRAAENWTATTVLVRQMSDQHWYVIGAQTPDILVTVPEAGATVDTPVRLEGQTRAYEGVVDVAVHGWGQDEPLGKGFVTGSGGTELGPFSDEVSFENTGGRGAVLFTVQSAKDGRITQATAVPVGFGPAS